MACVYPWLNRYNLDLSIMFLPTLVKVHYVHQILGLDVSVCINNFMVTKSNQIDF